MTQGYSQPANENGDAGGALFDRRVLHKPGGAEQSEHDKLLGVFVEKLAVPDIRKQARALSVDTF